MKEIAHYVLVFTFVFMTGCKLVSSTQKIDKVVYEKNAIPIGGKLSAASKRAFGLVRSLDTDKSPLQALRWGLCHEYRGNWQYIRRFESYMPHAL